ncbi:hypothetical protein ACFL1Q_02225 [Patescibacteria group bacterium]
MRLNRLIYPLLLSIVSLISFSQLFKGYFWLDDYTYLYYAQQHLPQSSYAFPYNFGVLLADQLYKIFGLGHSWYLMLALVLYICAVLLVYLFINSIIKNNKLSFLSCLIIACGYVGQGSLMMVIGDGLYILLGLNMMLLSLISLFKYLKGKRNSFLILSLVGFFLTLEFAPTRFGGLVLIIIALDFIFSKNLKRNYTKFVKRSILFSTVFLIQYFIHPTRFILNYYVSNSNLLPTIHLNYLINPLGTFWNIFFPTGLRDSIIYFLKNSHLSYFVNNIFFYALPSIIFVSLILGLIKLVKGRALSSKKFIKVCLFIAIMSLFSGMLVTKFITVPAFQMSTVNGSILLMLLIVLLFLKIPKFYKLSIFSLLLSIGLMAMFILFKPEMIIESPYRYMLLLSFIQPFIMSFFITGEIFEKTSKQGYRLRKNYFAWAIFMIPVLFLTSSHFLMAIYSQHKDYLLYNKDRSNIFNQLKIQIPNISKKTAIYIEGKDRQLNYSVGDAMRVGTLTSQASIAVNYQTVLENIILPETTGNLLQILKNNPNLSDRNIFTFIYDGHVLKDTSPAMRQLLEVSRQISGSAVSWKVNPEESLVTQNPFGVVTKTAFYSYSNNTLGIYPRIVISSKENLVSLLPIKIQLSMQGKLFSKIPVPYYHLHFSPDPVERSLWQEVLSWRMGQCNGGDYVKPFECILDKSLVRNLIEDTSQTGRVEISWKYNTYGLLSQPKKTYFDVSLDGKLHSYEFTIPAGGEYLKEIEINYISFPGFLSVYNPELSYIK